MQTQATQEASPEISVGSWSIGPEKGEVELFYRGHGICDLPVPSSQQLRREACDLMKLAEAVARTERVGDDSPETIGVGNASIIRVRTPYAEWTEIELKKAETQLRARGYTPTIDQTINLLESGDLPPEEEKPTLPPAPVLEAIDKILEYMWFDESEHYQTSPAQNHIFHQLQTVREWFDQTRAKPIEGHVSERRHEHHQDLPCD